MPDILDTPAVEWTPSESATSDNPSASQTVVTETPIVTVTPGDTQPEDKTQSDSEPTQDDQSSSTPEVRQPRGVQKALDRLTREREEARAAERAANERLDKVLSALETQQKQPVVEAKPSGPPKIEDFSSPDEYDAAVISYRVDQAVSARLEAQERARVEAQAQSEAKRALDAAVATFEDRKAEVKKVLTDFDDVVTNDTQVTPFLAMEMLHSEMGPQIAYHLSKNPAEAARLNGLAGHALSREIGKLEAKLSLQPIVSVSKASPPITPTKGSGPEVKADLERMSMDEFVAQRNKEEAASRGR